VIASRIPSRRITTATAVTIILSCLITVVESEHATQAARGIMTVSLRVLWVATTEKLALTLLVATMLSLVGFIGLHRSLRATLGGLLLVASVSTVLTHAHLREVGQVADGQMTTAHLVPESVTCLSHDRSTTKPYAVWLYRVQLPKIEHTVINLAGGETPCGEYVIAGQEALRNCLGSEFLGKEPRAEWGLWRYPQNKCG